MAGVSSILLLTFLHVLFPHWDNSPIEFFNTFFFIAPREELVKLLAFLFIGGITSRKTEHPVATMYYMGMVGLGFAMYENIQYVMMYGQQVLGIRLVTATVAHLLFGMFMGYWIAKGRLNSGEYGNRSVFGVLMAKSPQVKQYFYVLLGWMSAIGYHGLWNYNLMIASQSYPGFSDVSSSPIMIMMIFFGLVGAKFAGKDLNDHYRIDLKNKSKKPLTD
jgi:RsiW-degrading membrane proteinase PrsW (M82 family)